MQDKGFGNSDKPAAYGLKPYRILVRNAENLPYYLRASHVREIIALPACPHFMPVA
ncbi:hypothetical protein F7734_15415 [Scytonema sp. UIC 10036]|uniref:hypothetical protein n=1 Tax=Scytonema sp. UIC 10036 TaxID=2304196 RepID=UPI0012DA5272|nr:hypothetical protein [Scytonema sp. UIC 10036]MUG93730.1 hypothetical protein [Scytonema sp. UIC 10036]